jgi:hypothetical protein
MQQYLWPETKPEKWPARSRVSRYLSGLLFVPNDGGSMSLRNVSYLPCYTTSHPIRPNSSHLPLWEHQIQQQRFLICNYIETPWSSLHTCTCNLSMATDCHVRSVISQARGRHRNKPGFRGNQSAQLGDYPTLLLRISAPNRTLQFSRSTAEQLEARAHRCLKLQILV